MTTSTVNQYPRKNEAGDTVWACCESGIGPRCEHLPPLDFWQLCETAPAPVSRCSVCRMPHGAPLEWLPAGRGWWVCRHCLEPVCDTCEEPQSLCTCEPGEAL